MKPTRRERDDLLGRMQAARQIKKLSFTEVARRAGIDPSQASRICRGEFVTFGDNVVRICMVLDVPLRPSDGTSARPAQEANDAGWARLERSVRQAWDKTPGGADRLAKVIMAVAELARR